MKLDFAKMFGYVIVVVQHWQTKQVLMVGVMNKKAFKITEQTGHVTFWSRSRNCLWTKGESSGNFLKVKEIRVDCDNDTLLILAEPVGPTCHTGAVSCFESVDGSLRRYEKEEGMLENMRALRLAVPDGSMMKVVMEWLRRAGITVQMISDRIKSGTTNVPFINSVTLMRPQEIPVYLAQWLFDVAIANEDWVRNWMADVVILLTIPVGRATNQAVRIVLAVARESGYKSVKNLPLNAVIATEYVELTERYLLENSRPDISVIRSYGGTEQKVEFGADAIVDVTETGDSLVANGLVVIDEIMISNTVIAVNKTAYADPELRPLIDWFVAVIRGVVEGEKYILMQANVPEEKLDQAVAIIGGMLSPTKNPLAIPGWYELSSYVEKSRQHEVIFQLLQIGVKDICLSDSVSMVMGT